jgi:hypothetical protein
VGRPYTRPRQTEVGYSQAPEGGGTSHHDVHGITMGGSSAPTSVLEPSTSALCAVAFDVGVLFLRVRPHQTSSAAGSVRTEVPEGRRRHTS